MSFGKFLGDSSDKKNNEQNSTTYSAQPRGSLETILGQGSKVVGRLDFKEAAEIHGEVEGDICSQSRLVIGEQSRIRGTIDGCEVVIQGIFDGDVRASKRLVLKRPCKFKGNIFSSVLSIEEGVAFEGKCSMPQEAAAAETRSNPTAKPAQPLFKSAIISNKQTGVAA